MFGSQCSLHALVDGQNYRMLATARDHKRAYDGDEGPNTRGHGCVQPGYQPEWRSWKPSSTSKSCNRCCAFRERRKPLSRSSFSRPHDYGRWAASAGIQLPVRRSGDAGNPAASEIRSLAAASGDDRWKPDSRPARDRQMMLEWDDRRRSRWCWLPAAIPTNTKPAKPIKVAGPEAAAIEGVHISTVFRTDPAA